MKAWVQILLSLVVIVIVGGLWYAFFPGAPQVLARYGIVHSTGDASGNPAAASGGRGGFAGRFGPRTSNVEVMPATLATINDKVNALGTGVALHSVAVTPSASGTLTELDVASGAHVSAGQVIARMDSSAQKIARDKAALALSDAQKTLERYKKLGAGTSVTAVQMQAAELAVSNAQLSLRNAELDLKNREITAPIAGSIGILQLGVGDAVTTQTTLVTIEDRSAILVDFSLPERLVGVVKVGDPVTVVPVARPSEQAQGTVIAIGNAIDANSGTFSVRASMPNKSDLLRAGMAFTVSMNFAGDTYMAVDPLAIQWGSDGAYVWRVEKGKVNRVPVRIVQRNTESVLVAGKLDKGDEIVTEGLSGLRQGGEVSILGADGAPAASASGSNSGARPQSGQRPANGAPASRPAGS